MSHKIILCTIFVLITLIALTGGTLYDCSENNDLQQRLNKLLETVSKATDIQSLKAETLSDADKHGSGWTVILRRMDGTVNFYKNWNSYKNGFGNSDGEFFLGLDQIHELTSRSRQELLVVVEDFEGEERFQKYDDFAIGNEDQQYKLHTLGKSKGTAGDSLDYHRGAKFSTYDRDNDESLRNCAETYYGAWWYKGCHHSQLTGRYRDNSPSKGVYWFGFRGDEYSLKRAVMMIRNKT